LTDKSVITPTKAVMILDDESDIVYIFRKSLELAGYSAFAFTDPFAALEHLEANIERYGLVISDIRMPKMSGVDFASQVRKINPTVSLILMSAFSMKDIAIPQEINVAECLQKPITPNQLKQMVLKYIPLIQLNEP